MKNISMKKLYAFGEKRSIDLSLSENPLGCSPLVGIALKKLKFNFNDYPKPNGMGLKKILAEENKLSPENIFVANGSEAIICALPRLFIGQKGNVVMPSLTFPMFETCSLLAGLKVKTIPMAKDLAIDLKAMKKKVDKKTRLVFLCNPNNPTGSVLSKKEIVNFLNSLPRSILLIVDEANIEFGGESVISEVKNKKNLIVLRTFSKGFGLASLRIGFAAANKEVVDKLEKMSQPFSTSGLSEILVKEALKDKKFIKKTKSFVKEQREIMKEELNKLGFTVFPSEANNLFVKLPRRIKVDPFLKMLEKNDISLVMGKSFSGFGNRFFRVSIRDEKTNKKFLKQLILAFK